MASLSGALVKGVVPKNGHHLTLEEVKANAVVSEDVHACPTRVISLENTLAGEIMPLSDCQSISEWARAQSPPIKLHLDGARLWEAVSAQVAQGEHGGDLKRGIKDYCACFDSVSLCFSKGLGAPIGSIIVGSKAFIKSARHIRKAIGGGLRQAGVITAAARVSVEETFLGGKLAGSHERARTIARMWVGKGGKLGRAVETNMVWFDLESAGVEVKEFVEIGVKEGVRLIGGRLVVHYRERPIFLSSDRAESLDAFTHVYILIFLLHCFMFHIPTLSSIYDYPANTAFFFAPKKFPMKPSLVSKKSWTPSYPPTPSGP